MSFGSSGLSEKQAEETWSTLHTALKDIQEGKAGEYRFEELYRSAYNLVLHKRGAFLYESVKKVLQDRIGVVADRVKKLGGDEVLSGLVKEWVHYKNTMKQVKQVLMYMDHTYCLPERKTPVYDLGLDLFRTRLIKLDGVAGAVSKALLSAVEKDRDGGVIDRATVKDALDMLVECNLRDASLYVELFEKQFLADTHEYYKNEMDAAFTQNSIPDFLRKVESRLREEEYRMETYLHKSSRQALTAELDDVMIVKYAQQVCNEAKTGVTNMIAKDTFDDIGLVYRLLKRAPERCMKYLHRALSEAVKTEGKKIVHDASNSKNPKQFVARVLAARQKYFLIITAALQHDRTFAATLKAALEHFINLDSRSAQYLSLYVDDMMRSQMAGVCFADVDRRLNDVLSIFRYLQDKDVFEDFYRQHLAARLLHRTYFSEDMERRMIGKLKSECGHHFTSRLEGMFGDMENSAELTQGFLKAYESSLNLKKRGLSLDFTVLTKGFWPLAPLGAINYPSEAKSVLSDFAKYYQRQHTTRKLVWQGNVGDAIVQCRFKAGTKLLKVPTFMMVVLMLFNENDKLSFKQIEEATNIPRNELIRHLLSMAHPRVRILRKSPNNKSIADDHTFEFNTGYASALEKIRVPVLSSKAVGLQKKKVVSPEVLEARKTATGAAIVRVLKNRKTITHADLVEEVMKHMQTTQKFSVDPAFIKQQIESLIDRKYVSRDKDDRQKYHYHQV